MVERSLPWLMRGMWVIVLLVGSETLDGALEDNGRATALRVAALIAWIAGVAAMAVPSVGSLTATRVIVPVAVPVAVTAWIAGAPAGMAVAFVVTALLTTILAASADIGRVFVQASAYGHEDRHPLRPPAAYLSVAVLAWLLWAGLGITAAVATSEGPIWLAALLGAATLAGMLLGLPRWHRLSRRWLVLVPVGLVVHDDLVLAETIMWRRQQLDRIGLAPAGTDAADLTGPSAGHALEVRTTESVTVVLSAATRGGSLRPIHLTGALVAPTRPGRALAMAAERRLPVGAIG